MIFKVHAVSPSDRFPKTLLVFLFVCFFLFHCNAALAGSDSANTSVVPWSGYWWSMVQGELALGYAGHPSPTEKYDQYLYGTYPAILTELELSTHYRPDGVPWAGHCNGWAASSIRHGEPGEGGYAGGILFNVGDLKGILAEAYYEGISYESFGKRYGRSPGGENWDIADIYPGKLWHELSVRIGDNDTPVVLDLYCLEEVWNYPVYGYTVTWTKVGWFRYSCELTIQVADDKVPPDFVGTQNFSRRYTFEITMIDVFGTPVVFGKGEWTGDSVNDHPDFGWYPTSEPYDSSRIDYGTIEEIISETGN